MVSAQPSLSTSQLTGELSAVLGAAYESFLKARLERRQGRRVKVHAKAVVSFLEMVTEMLDDEAGDPEAMWHMAVVELDRDRGEIEADVLEHHGHIEVEHEWPAFLEWVGQFRGS